MATTTHASVTLADLRSAGLTALETIYAGTAASGVPHGCYRGHFLCFIDSDGARDPRLHAMIDVGFRRTPFGVDFDRRRWFFVTPLVGIGRFVPRVQRSRWRDTMTVTLDYETSRLPGWIRRGLYDEVQPLNDTLCLGLGGVNGKRGWGDLFFFALERFADSYH